MFDLTLPNTQLTDAFQIAEFYKYVKNTTYHVLLFSTTKNVTVVDEAAPYVSTLKTGFFSTHGNRMATVGFEPMKKSPC